MPKIKHFLQKRKIIYKKSLDNTQTAFNNYQMSFGSLYNHIEYAVESSPI